MNFTHLKPKSPEEIFKDKSDEDIVAMFENLWVYYFQSLCIDELIKRDAKEALLKIHQRWPNTVRAFLLGAKTETEYRKYLFADLGGKVDIGYTADVRVGGFADRGFADVGSIC